MMFRFGHIEYLYGLLIIPLLIILFIVMVQWRKRALYQFGNPVLLMRLMPERSPARLTFKFILFLFAGAFLIIGLANPQRGSKLEDVKRKGVDLMVALDISNSMMAEDIKPNRLDRSKQAISQLIDGLGGDRIGIVVFAGKAFTQLPITSDYAAAKMFLSTINPQLIPEQGTAVGNAIELAAMAFKEEDDKKNKAIIVITDGENHEDDAVGKASQAAEKGIVVHTIGMGLTDGAPIPVYRNNRMMGFKKNREGNTIVTKLDEFMLREIAVAGNGKYVRANNTKAGVKYIFQQINKMEEKEFESRIYSDYEDRFQYFLAAGLILLLIEFLLNEKKSKFLSRIKLFKNKISGNKINDV